VVISIIILLAGMLLPSLSKAIQLSYVAKSRSQVSGINSAILQFKNDKGYYPGRGDDESLMDGEGGNLSGSQILSLALWGRDRYWDNNGSGDGLYYSGGWQNEDKPASNYLGYKQEFVIRKSDPDDWKQSDAFPDALPIAYWPSEPGTTGDMTSSAGWPASPAIAAFTFANSSGDCGSSPSETNWRRMICNTKFNKAKAYNYDTFLLIAPGADRKYFADIANPGQAGDDVTNINR
jgi:type II secretory pathway pseudopilin PulG